MHDGHIQAIADNTHTKLYTLIEGHDNAITRAVAWSRRTHIWHTDNEMQNMNVSDIRGLVSPIDPMEAKLDHYCVRQLVGEPFARRDEVRHRRWGGADVLLVDVLR